MIYFASFETLVHIDTNGQVITNLLTLISTVLYVLSTKPDLGLPAVFFLSFFFSPFLLLFDAAAVSEQSWRFSGSYSHLQALNGQILRNQRWILSPVTFH